MAKQSTLRGFGLTITAQGARRWYVGRDGIKRWADSDQPCEQPVERARRQGCSECAWGKVLACWKCGGRNG